MKLSIEDGEKILNHVNGIAGEKDSDDVRALFSAGEDNEQLKNFIANDWNGFMNSDITTGEELRPLLDNIHHQIRLDEFKRNRTFVRKLSVLYARAAAVILIPLLLGTGYLLLRGMAGDAGRPAVASIYAPAGSRVAFSLPDGTEGMLNSGSRLSYTMPFEKKRNVALNGEAWFEVTPDVKHPFRIDAGKLKLTVLGTTFNVNAYPDENYTEVVLETGSILVNCGQYKEGMVMQPSERLIYRSGKITRSNADPSKYSSWTEGKLVFRSDSMSEVARRIERWYNVNVELMDSDLENYSFRATFEDDPLEEVLKFLSMTSPIRYEITPREIMADSTFAKSTVKIYLK
ncbi:MAG: FecR domain-containing protein [Bacteroidales bacterium]